MTRLVLLALVCCMLSCVKSVEKTGDNSGNAGSDPTSDDNSDENAGNADNVAKGGSGGVQQQVTDLFAKVEDMGSQLNECNKKQQETEDAVQSLAAQTTLMQTDLNKVQVNTQMLIDNFNASRKGIFYAYVDTNLGGLQTGMTVKFDGVRFEKNGDYDTNTGIFTAPVGGTYMFQLCMRTSGTIEAHIMVNSAIAANTQCWYYNACGFGFAQIKKGDQIYVKIGSTKYRSSYFYGLGWSHFGGFIINPEVAGAVLN